MAVTQVPIGLKKQAEGDLDWEVALNAGFDDANTRLTLQGTADPSGVVAGYWVGQQYIRISGAYVQPWVCITATGVAATTLWRRSGVGSVNGSGSRMQYWDVAAAAVKFLPGAMRVTHAHPLVAFGTAGAVLTDTPTVTIVPPTDIQFNEYSLVALGWATMSGTGRKLSIQQSIDLGAYATIAPDFLAASGVTCFALGFNNQLIGGTTSLRYRLVSDAVANTGSGLLVWAVSKFGASGAWG